MCWMGVSIEMRRVRELLTVILLLPFALLMAVLTYLDWYVFGDFPKRKF